MLSLHERLSRMYVEAAAAGTDPHLIRLLDTLNWALEKDGSMSEVASILAVNAKTKEYMLSAQPRVHLVTPLFTQDEIVELLAYDGYDADYLRLEIMRGLSGSP